MSGLSNIQLAALPMLSRRRGPRVSVPSSISVRTAGSDGLDIAAIKDIGFRGFAIETRTPVAARTAARFEFLSGDRQLFVVDAVVVHCFRQPGEDSVFISGWEFDENSGMDEAIERLMNEAVGVLTIE